MSTTKTEAGWIPDVSHFGARLALVRWKMDWNRAEAERECGVSQNLWAGWESGVSPHDQIKVAEKIAARSGVNKMWLLLGEGDPSDYMGALTASRVKAHARPPRGHANTHPKGRA